MTRWAGAIIVLALSPLAWGQATMLCMKPAEAKRVYGMEGKGIHYARLVTEEGVSGIHAVLVDDVGVVEKTTKTLTLPAIVAGEVEALAVDRFRFAGKKGQAVSIEAFAARLGSKLDPLVRVMEATGKELARCDDDPEGTTPDSRIELKLPGDGEYVVEVRDAAYEGSREHRYYLRIAETPLPRAQIGGPAEAEPNDSPAAATALGDSIAGRFHAASDVDHYRIEGKRGERVEVRAATRSIGWPCDVSLKIVATDGAVLAQSKPADADDGVVSYKFSQAGTAYVVVRELNQQFGPSIRYRLVRGPARPTVTLTIDVDTVNAVPGADVSLKVTAIRKDNKGAVTLSAPGFEVSNNVVAEGKTETTLKVKVPKEIDPSKAHQLTIEGRMKGDDEAAVASTAAALKRSFPKLMHVPAGMDDAVVLGVKRTPTTRPATSPAKR